MQAFRICQKGRGAGEWSWLGQDETELETGEKEGLWTTPQGLAEQEGYSFVVFLQESLGLLGDLHTLVLWGQGVGKKEDGQSPHFPPTCLPRQGPASPTEVMLNPRAKRSKFLKGHCQAPKWAHKEQFYS